MSSSSRYVPSFYREQYSPSKAPPLSRSAIIAESMSGSHILTIQGYSLLKAHGLGVGKCITSKSFLAGGHRWFLQYYPHGKTSPDWISIYVLLDNPMKTDAVNARYNISLLDQDENPVPSYTIESNTFCILSGQETPLGASNSISISKDDLESSAHLLKNDAFSVRCDITVMEVKIKDIPTTPAVHYRRGH